MRSLDLSTAEGVMAYLNFTQFASSSVTELIGGYCNATYRLHLVTPYEGRQTVVLKYASHRTFLGAEIPVCRQKYEALALQLVKSSISPSIQAVTTVPKLHLFDEDAHVIIMDDALSEPGANVVASLKELLIDPEYAHLHSPELAKEIGKGLGEFLASLHRLGETGEDGDSVDLSPFRANDLWRKVAAEITFGVVESVLTGGQGLPFIDDPPLDISRSDMEVIRRTSQKAIAEIRGENGEDRERHVMTHGDFWSGNIVVCISADDSGGACLKRMYIVDWEKAKTCIPVMDVGHCSAELSLVQWWFAGSPAAEAAAIIRQEYLGAYGRDTRRRPETSRQVDLDRMGREVVLHVGTHYVCWQPRFPWGEKERVRAVVKEGAAMIVEAGAEDGGSSADEYKALLGCKIIL